MHRPTPTPCFVCFCAIDDDLDTIQSSRHSTPQRELDVQYEYQTSVANFPVNRWNGIPEPSFDGLSVLKKLLTGACAKIHGLSVRGNAERAK